MRKSDIRRVCPECGRELETCYNKLHIEMWPAHRVLSATDMTVEEYIKAYRSFERLGLSHDEIVRQCLNSATPVLLE